MIRSVRRGHSPNCSSAGSVVGVALVSLVASAVVLNMWADRFARWAKGGPGSGKLRGADGLLHLEVEGEAAILTLDAEDVEAAKARATPLTSPPAPAGAQSAPLEVHLAVTTRCPVRCAGCYLDASPEGAEPDHAALMGALEDLAAQGVFEVAFGGGETLLREDLFALLQRARALGLVPNLTTSGFGLDPAKARRLAGLCGQVNVSMDGPGAVYAAVRGWDGAGLALRSIATLREAGVRVGVNTVMSRPLLETPGALSTLGRAIAEAGASEWQWLRFKPAGRGGAEWARLAPSPEHLDGLWPQLLALESETGLVMRMDCALVPFVVSHAPDRGAVERLALTGCPGGSSLFARSASGAWGPCSFAVDEQSPENSSSWQNNATLKTWRERAAAPPEPCGSCEWRAICRGGCRVVAGFLTGDPLAADPECPRVRGVLA